MASTTLENRAYFTISGSKYSLAGLIKDIAIATGTLSKHVQSMSIDGNPAGIILTNYAPTITWTELVPTAAVYVKLLNFLYSNLQPVIVVQPFIIGEDTPSGEATQFTGCTIAGQDVNFQSQDIEGTRRIIINATSYVEL